MRDDNARPEGLSEAGNNAYEVILEILKAENALETGGCRTFYSPEEWSEREEDYCTDAELIVVYDGGAVGPYFSLDHDHPKYRRYEKMRTALEAAGFYAEQGTHWYAGVYKN